MERNEVAASGDKEIVQRIAGSGSDAENNAVNVDRSAPAPVPVPEPITATRVPFTALSQVNSDMALARALQDQERAYFLLQVGHGGDISADTARFYYEGVDVDVSGDAEEDQDEGGEEEEGDDEGVEDEEEHDPLESGGEGTAANHDQIDSANFDSDEAFARALQDKEDRDTTARLMALAGIHDVGEELETDSSTSQVMWEDVDPDDMSYEELIALGEAVGTESKGLSPQSVATLRQFSYISDFKDNTIDQEQCVVCRLEYEDGDKMLRLPCNHQYHSGCIQQWFERNKVCPICGAEVTSESSTHETKS